MYKGKLAKISWNLCFLNFIFQICWLASKYTWKSLKNFSKEIHVRARARMYAYVHAYTRAYTRAYIYILRVRARRGARACVCMRTRVCACVHARSRACVCACARVCTRACARMWAGVRVHARVYTRVCTRTCVRARACMRMRARVYARVGASARVYACLRTRTRDFSLRRTNFYLKNVKKLRENNFCCCKIYKQREKCRNQVKN